MNIAIVCQDHSSAEYMLTLNKKLGEGKFSVYQVYSPSQKKNYAFKVFPKTPFGTEQYEKELLSSSLRHPNIIEFIPLRCISNQFYSVITEFAKHGDFLNLMTAAGPLKNETLIRTYFKQLIEGLEYIHSQGLAHLDLKLENLVVGDDLLLKIIDFDQAQPLNENHMTSAGTPNYRPPEVIDERCKNLTAADIYSVGVILFTLRAGQFPFVEINKKEGLCLYPYSLFAKDNRQFWKDKEAFLEDGDHFDEDFIQLVNGMLNFNPEKRFTIQQIKESKWFKGPVLSKESLDAEMKKIIDNLMN